MAAAAPPLSPPPSCPAPATKMKFVALLSGGKDSVFAIMEAERHGHELVCAAHLAPADADADDDADTDLDLSRFFGAAAYSGYHEGVGGFFSVYHDVFERIRSIEAESRAQAGVARGGSHTHTPTAGKGYRGP